MSSISGGFPDIVSINCRECGVTYMEQRDIETYAFQTVCSCGSKLRMHVKIVTENGSQYNHIAVTVRGVECNNYIKSAICFKGTNEHRILNVKDLGDKIIVAVEGHTKVNCDPDSLWVIIEGDWYDSWPEI